MIENEENGAPNETEPTAEAGENAFEALKDGILGKVTGALPEGALEKAAELLDQDGDGNPINDLKGLAGRFLGKGQG